MLGAVAPDLYIATSLHVNMTIKEKTQIRNDFGDAPAQVRIV
jgi:hypothetical protein